MEPAPASSTVRALASLLRRNADYRRLFWATVISFAGDWFAFVAVSGFVADATGHGGLAAVVYAASVLPVFLLAPVAGVLADRMDRKRLMVAVDLARVPLAAGMVLAMKWHSPALAIVLVAALAGLSAFFEPVSAAAVPNLVAEEDLPIAQAALASLWGSMLLVGAAIGGVVSATLGRNASFLFNALTFLLSAVLVIGIRRPLQQARTESSASMMEHLGEVWALVRRERVTASLLVIKAGTGMAQGVIGLLPAFAMAQFGTGDGGVGILLASRGLGALVGPLLARSFIKQDGRRLFVAAGVSMLVYGVSYLLLPWAPTLRWAVAFVTLAHLGGGTQWMLSTYGLQVTTADSIRGRVLTIDFGVATLSIGMSSLLAGGASEIWGLRQTTWGLASLAIVYGLCWLAWTRPLWRAQTDPLTRPQVG